MHAVTEWKDIATEAVKAVVVLFILERIFLTRHESWLEVRARRHASRAQQQQQQQPQQPQPQQQRPPPQQPQLRPHTDTSLPRRST
jgi:hypothetical protein